VNEFCWSTIGIGLEEYNSDYVVPIVLGGKTDSSRAQCFTSNRSRSSGPAAGLGVFSPSLSVFGCVNTIFESVFEGLESVLYRYSNDGCPVPVGSSEGVDGVGELSGIIGIKTSEEMSTSIALAREREKET
jgi:hypothetical protein